MESHVEITFIFQQLNDGTVALIHSLLPKAIKSPAFALVTHITSLQSPVWQQLQQLKRPKQPKGGSFKQQAFPLFSAFGIQISPQLAVAAVVPLLICIKLSVCQLSSLTPTVAPVAPRCQCTLKMNGSWSLRSLLV